MREGNSRVIIDLSAKAGRYTVANPSKEVRPMMETLTMLLVVFAAMSFIVALITLVVVVIKAMNKK